MSGGHFDYNQYHIEDIANKLQREIADIEYAKTVGIIKKKEVYAYLIDVNSGRKYWPNWLLEATNRRDSKDDVVDYLVKYYAIRSDDGKLYHYYVGIKYEVVVYEGEIEEYADGKYHLEIEDAEVVEEFKKGLKILKTAAIYAQRIDWLLSGDDGEDSFKKRLKEELDELESKPLIDYEYWFEIFKENDNE